MVCLALEIRAVTYVCPMTAALATPGGTHSKRGSVNPRTNLVRDFDFMMCAKGLRCLLHFTLSYKKLAGHPSIQKTILFQFWLRRTISCVKTVHYRGTACRSDDNINLH